jgi:hypothetical protein
MKKPLVVLAILSIALTVSARAFSQSRSGAEDLSRPAHDAPPMLGIHWARGFNPSYLQQHAHTGGTSSPDMSYHGGKILTTAVIQAIFWGTSWNANVGDEISGLDDWYTGFSGSNYAAISDEYTGSNVQVGPDTTYSPGRYVVDNSRASSGNKTSAILAEVCKVITPDSSGNGYYAVYVDLPRKGSYCAYHSWGSCKGVPVQFAFFWKLDGDSGCDPQSTVPNQSEGLAALANVSGHELSEARTDPTGAGWYDSGGAENGDKCVWTFNVPYVTFPKGSTWTEWKIQGEWSNAAYNGGTGYPNSAGQDGCLDGDDANEPATP